METIPYIDEHHPEIAKELLEERIGVLAEILGTLLEKQAHEPSDLIQGILDETRDELAWLLLTNPSQ